MDYRQVIALQERWGASPGAVDALAFGFMSFALRTRGDPAHAIPSVRRAITLADPEAGIDAIAPVDRLVSNSVARQRFYAVMLAGFAAIAAVLGRSGSTACWPMRSSSGPARSAFGWPWALGVGRCSGPCSDAACCWPSPGSRWDWPARRPGRAICESMLYGVTPLDRGTFLAVALAFAAVAALALYMPARRATQVDPMVTLRTD